LVFSNRRDASSPPALYGMPTAPSDHALTVVIPAHNEEHRLPMTLRDLQWYLDSWGIDYRVVVVDDGSTDNTARLTSAFDSRFSTLELGENRGKGAAVRAGVLAATGRIVAFTDADLPYDLSALRQGVLAVQLGLSDVVLGARDLENSRQVVRRQLRRALATVVFRKLIQALISHRITDSQCGLKVFSRAAARAVFARSSIDGFAFDAEVVFLVERLGFRYQRIAVALINEYTSSLSMARHALPMILDVLRIRWRAGRGHYDLHVVPELPVGMYPVRRLPGKSAA
jgi:dolichyl-phosphate beta-glucosyltransferase